MFKEGERVLCIGESNGNRNIIGHIGRVINSDESFTAVEFNCYVDRWENCRWWLVDNSKLVSMDNGGRGRSQDQGFQVLQPFWKASQSPAYIIKLQQLIKEWEAQQEVAELKQETNPLFSEYYKGASRTYMACIEDIKKLFLLNELQKERGDQE